MRRRRALLAFTFACGLCSVAEGTPTATGTPTSGTSATVMLIMSGPHAGKYDVTLSNTQSGQPATFTIRGLSTENIRFITLSNTTSQTALIDVGGSVGQDGIGSIDLIDMGSSAGQNQLRVVSTGSVGSIRVNDILSPSQVFGDVTGEIELVPEGGGGSASLSSLQIDGSLYGDVSALGGPINSLVVSGDIGTPSAPVTIQTSQNIGQIDASNVYADISTPSDRNIERLFIDGDFVGSLTTANFALTTSATQTPRGLSITGDSDATIELAGSFQLPATITGALTGSVTALTNSSGNAISVGSIPAGGEFWLQGFTSTTTALGAPLTVSGPIAGTLKFGRPSSVERGDINQNVTVNGPVSGMIRTYGNLSGGGVVLALNGGLTTTGQVFIGNTLGGTITLPAPGGGNPGLAGQIIINADDMSGTWNGQVKIGTGGGAIDIPPSPTSSFHGRYAHLPSELGGGSIGLAPFQLHEEACTPIHDDPTPSLSSIFNPNAEPCGSDYPIVIRSYGPITKDDEASWMQTIKVEATTDGFDCGWQEVSSVFTAILHPDPTEGGRALVLKKANASMKDPARLRYRVIPRNGDYAILCKDVGTTSPLEVTWPVNCENETTEAEAYLFELIYDCNSNCVEDSIDIANDPTLDDGDDKALDGIIDDCQDGGCHACDISTDPFDPTVGDGMIDLADLVSFLTLWQPNIGHPDPNGLADGDYLVDNVVDLADLIKFLECWQPNIGVPCE